MEKKNFCKENYTPSENDENIKYNNLKKMKFTISVSPSLSRSNFELLNSEVVLNSLKKNSDKIHDINFTCHIPPFMKDAHGVYISDAENEIHLRQLVEIQEKTGISITPVFNDIYISNSYENLELFVKNFKRLYDYGIKSITVPHILWLKMGLLQKTFSDLRIKNTVLRRVRTGQEFWNHAEAGYDYINLDRVITRDMKNLQDIYAAQKLFEKRTGKYVKTSILTGEGCIGACSLWEEHYQHTLTHPDTNENLDKNLKIFRYPQNFSCLAFTDPEPLALMSVGLPFFKEDIENVCKYFDIIKLAGRRAFQSISDNLKVIESFFTNDELFPLNPPEIIKYFIANDKKYNSLLLEWREKTKTCRFQCWNCNMCSKLTAHYISR